MESDIARVLCVDFDGVIHAYSKGWLDGSIYDPPMEGAIEAMMELQSRGYWLIVFTTRADLDAVDKWLEVRWLEQLERMAPGAPIKTALAIHPIPEVTGGKPGAAAYIDDHAWRFDAKLGGWDSVLSDFRGWW